MQYIKLGEVISSAKVDRCGDNDYPVLSITKSEGLMLQSDKFKKRIASHDTNQYKVVKKGQLVQGIHIDEANFGIQSLVEEGIVSPAYKIWDVNTEMIVPKYLEILLRSPRSIRYYSSKFNGSIKRRERITDNDFLSMMIPCPSITEQQYAVDIVEKVRKLILLRKTEIEKYDELIKARFVEVFGDYHTNSKGFESHKGSELFKFASGKFLPEEKRLGEGIPVYGGNGIAWYTDEPLIEYPTIIIGRVGALCGNIHSVREPVWITDNAIYIKEHKTEKFTLEFLTEMMTIMDFYQYADFSGQPKITQKPLESLHYLTPPIEMQNEFTEFCKQVDKSKVVVQKALDEAQLLFDSLMQEYFG